MQKDIDIIIYGATGFTGKLCVKYFQSLDTTVTWAMAGRNLIKLEKVAKENQTNVEILIADSDDEKALDNLTSRARVILSTTGPFHRYGSKLVASCIKNHTHYVDITGENFWVKGLIEKHHKEASAKGIRIIPSCGFDSIPSDLGTFFAAKALSQPIKRIESFHSYQGGASGGTLETMFSMGELDLGDDLTDPFLLNPDDSYSNKQKQLYDLAISSVKSTISIVKSNKTIQSYREQNLNKHVMTLHDKFSLGFACIILFFIGAPLGTIIRKGGYGLPLVISILLFLSYHFLGIFSKNLAEDSSINPVLASWLSTLIMFPLSIYLTYRATNDQSVFNFGNNLISFYKKIENYVKR